MKDSEIEEIIKNLASDDADVRRAAAESLGKLAGKAVILLDGIDVDSQNSFVAGHLSTLVDKDATEALQKAIEYAKGAIAFGERREKSLELLAPKDLAYLRELRTLIDSVVERSGHSRIVFETEEPLDTDFLVKHLLPLIKAIEDIQKILNEIKNKSENPCILFISQRSPISVDLGGAADALQVLREMLIPWRRKHAQTIAFLLEQEKQLEIESKKAEIIEKRLRLSKERTDIEKLSVEREKQRAEIERLQLENEKMRLELMRSKVQLALEILNELKPHLQEEDKIAYLIRLLPPIEKIISMDVEVRV